MPVLTTDQWEILKKLSLKKIYNALLVTSSYFFSKRVKKNYHLGMPFSISFEPTTSCNLRCPECPSGLRSFHRPTGMLEEDFFQKTIDQLKDELIYLTFYFQGEPYLNPKFLEMVSYAQENRIYTATSTNAHYLSEQMAERTVKSGLSKLIISIDGTTQDTYEQYRVGGSLEKVISGTKNIVAAKKRLQSSTPFVVFQYLVVQPNEHQIEEAKQLAHNLGVDDIVFKTAQIYDYKDGSSLIPTLDQYSRYKKQEDGTYTIKNPLNNSCWRMWHSCVITWDGSIVPCCFDKDADHPMGNLQNQSFKNIWKSSPYNKFREVLLHSRSQVDICKNCTEGMRVFS